MTTRPTTHPHRRTAAAAQRPTRAPFQLSPAAEKMHPNASKRIPFFLPMAISQAPQPPSSSNPPPSLPNGNGNGNINGNNNKNSNNGNGTNIEDPVANYTLQGVMQWLNGEYRRYERERNAWEIERASLVVCVLLEEI